MSAGGRARQLAPYVNAGEQRDHDRDPGGSEWPWGFWRQRRRGRARPDGPQDSHAAGPARPQPGGVRADLRDSARQHPPVRDRPPHAAAGGARLSEGDRRRAGAGGQGGGGEGGLAAPAADQRTGLSVATSGRFGSRSSSRLRCLAV